MSKQIIDLIRHGEPEGGRCYRGHGVDDPLSQKGWQQMRKAIAAGGPWEHVVTSPLQRCKQFAEEVAEQKAITLRIVDDLKEIGFGEWEGRTPEQIKVDNLTQWQAFYQDPVNARPAGAENLDHFYARVSKAFFQSCEQASDQHILVVAHAGVIRAILCAVLQAPAASMYRIKIPNAGMSRIVRDEFGYQLESVNALLA